MKRLSLFALLLALSSFTIAQTPDTLTLRYKNELGIEGTYFIKQFLNWGSDQFGGYYYAAPTYFLTYKRKLGTCRLRTGIGGSFTTATDTGGSNSDTDLETRGYTLDMRAGLERAVPAGRRWVVSYGADILGGYSRSDRRHLNPDSYGADQRTEENRWGIGPMLGIQFQLTRHLSLTTEASVYLMWKRSDTRYWDDDDVPPTDSQSYSEDGNVFIGIPAYVFLIWHF